MDAEPPAGREKDGTAKRLEKLYASGRVSLREYTSISAKDRTRREPSIQGRKEEMNDPYVYGDGSDVLVNKLGIKDKAALQRHEYRVSAARTPLAVAHAARAITVNEKYGARSTGCCWARSTVGREVPHDAAVEGAYPIRASGSVGGVGGQEGLSRLRGGGGGIRYGHRGFCGGAGEMLGGAELPHPFREGNGRAMQIVVRELAARHGWLLDLDKVERAVEMSAAKRRQSGPTTPPIWRSCGWRWSVPPRASR